MAKNKKYNYKLQLKDQKWSVEIIRKVSKNKTVVSKQQDDFADEKEAIAWGEKQLIAFSSTMANNNQRHAEQRKVNAEIKIQRSQRRSEKTQKIKDEKAALAKEKEDTTKQLQSTMNFDLD